MNFINATSLAHERGVKIQESKSSREEEFVNLIQLEIRTDKEVKRVAGTLSANKQPRIVKIDKYYVEISPVGNLLMVQTWDKPGLIGSLGMLLGTYGINIAAMTFGREAPGGKAIRIEYRQPLSAEILKDQETRKYSARERHRI